MELVSLIVTSCAVFRPSEGDENVVFGIEGDDTGSHDCCVAAWVDTCDGRTIEAGWMHCWVVGFGGGRMACEDEEDDDDSRGNFVGMRMMVGGW